MALYDLNDKQQNLIGKKDHWKLFVVFKETPLYRHFITEITDFLEGVDTINSSQAGSKIINKISNSSPELLAKQPQSQIGSLFGMTLWHYLANREEEWRFSPIPKKENDEVTGTMYFRKKRVNN